MKVEEEHMRIVFFFFFVFFFFCGGGSAIRSCMRGCAPVRCLHQVRIWSLRHLASSIRHEASQWFPGRYHHDRQVQLDTSAGVLDMRPPELISSAGEDGFDSLALHAPQASTSNVPTGPL